MEQITNDESSLFEVFTENFYQQAPWTTLLHILNQIQSWPSLSSQEKLMNCLSHYAGQLNSRFCSYNKSLLGHSHLSEDNLLILLAPPKYTKRIFIELEKHIQKGARQDEEDDTFQDMFMETFLKVINPSISSDSFEEDFGLSVYSVRYSNCHRQRLPILVKRSHNQVGTRVWGAGLLLGEILQYLYNQNHGYFQNKNIFELGAGIGITSLLLLAVTDNDENSTDIRCSPSSIVMTDYTNEILELLKYNITNYQYLYDREQLTTTIEALAFDWTNTEDCKSKLVKYTPDIILAADCTYSEDLNLCLVDIFSIYFQIMKEKHNDKNNSNNHSQDYRSEIDREQSYEGSNHCQIIIDQLLRENIPFVMIACTERNEVTFQHFLNLCRAENEFYLLDISDYVHSQLITTPIYDIEFRSLVHIFCITHKELMQNTTATSNIVRELIK